MMPAIYSTLKITANVVTDTKAEVRASGKALKSPGFLDILGIKDDSKIEIPFLKIGDNLELYGKNPVRLEKKLTQPPNRYNFDSLIKDLDDLKIGRPSTLGELCSKITSKSYVEMRGNVFHPTDLGKEITNFLKKYFSFMDYHYTANMEKKLDLIAEGKLDHIQMLHEFYEPFKKELYNAYIKQGGYICKLCDSPMTNRKSKDGRAFIGCTNYPNCKNILKSNY